MHLHLMCECFLIQLSPYQFHFGNSGCTFHGTSFSLLLLSFLTLCSDLLFRFSRFLPSLLHTRRALPSRYKQQTSKFITCSLLAYKYIVLQNQAQLMWLSNDITQLIVLESCSSPPKTRQVFETTVKKIFWFWVSCFLCFLWVTS